MSQNYSRQRETLKENIYSRTDHPTAEMIYSSMKEIFPKLSLATVYRNLGQLEQAGSVRRIESLDGADRYDGDVSRHDHFYCKDCFVLLDVPKSEDHEGNAEMIEKAIGAYVDSYSTTYYGLCANCRTKDLRRK